jgi:hypothetical protein
MLVISFENELMESISRLARSHRAFLIIDGETQMIVLHYMYHTNYVYSCISFHLAAGKFGFPLVKRSLQETHRCMRDFLLRAFVSYPLADKLRPNSDSRICTWRVLPTHRMRQFNFRNGRSVSLGC